MEKWRDDKLEEQTAMPLSEMPKLTVSMIKSKVSKIKCMHEDIVIKRTQIKHFRSKILTARSNY